MSLHVLWMFLEVIHFPFKRWQNAGPGAFQISEILNLGAATHIHYQNFSICKPYEIPGMVDSQHIGVHDETMLDVAVD